MSVPPPASLPHSDQQTSCDLDAAWWLAEPAVDGGLSYAGAQIVLPDEPGLGIRGLR